MNKNTVRVIVMLQRVDTMTHSAHPLRRSLDAVVATFRVVASEDPDQLDSLMKKIEPLLIRVVNYKGE